MIIKPQGQKGWVWLFWRRKPGKQSVLHYIINYARLEA